MEQQREAAYIFERLVTTIFRINSNFSRVSRWEARKRESRQEEARRAKGGRVESREAGQFRLGAKLQFRSGPRVLFGVV